MSHAIRPNNIACRVSVSHWISPFFREAYATAKLSGSYSSLSFFLTSANNLQSTATYSSPGCTSEIFLSASNRLSMLWTHRAMSRYFSSSFCACFRILFVEMLFVFVCKPVGVHLFQFFPFFWRKCWSVTRTNRSDSLIFCLLFTLFYWNFRAVACCGYVLCPDWLKYHSFVFAHFHWLRTSCQNGPFPSSKNPHFQNEANWKTFHVKLSFICMRNKNYFHIKEFALNLVLKKTLEATRKWPCNWHFDCKVLFSLLSKLIFIRAPKMISKLWFLNGISR